MYIKTGVIIAIKIPLWSGFYPQRLDSCPKMFLKRCMIEWNEIIKVLKDGGVVTHPTDTCYGLTCDPLNRDAMNKVKQLKQMPDDKPVTIMVYDMGEAQKYGVFGKRALEIGSEVWPGALTLVLPRHDSDETIGIRVPGDDFTLELLSKWGGPLTTTSANLHGDPPPYSAADALRADYVVDFGEIQKNPPSTIIKVVGDEVAVIRAGEFKL